MDPIRILFVCPYVPSLLRIRPYNLVKELTRKGHQVTVLAVCTTEQDQRDAAHLEPHCDRLETIPVRLGRSLWNCAQGWRSHLPLQALYSFSPEMNRRLARELDARQPAHDLVHIEHLRAVVFGMKVTGVPRVYDSVDCISRLFEKTLRLARTPRGRLSALLDLERTRRFEGGLMRVFDRVLTSTEEDKRALMALAQGGHNGTGHSGNGHGAHRLAQADAISVVPNGVDLDYFSPLDQPREPATILFVGRMSYHANVTAVLHLVRDIMPKVWARRPDAKLVVVGPNPPREIRALARRHAPLLEVTGHVPDIRPYLASATVSVSPLVYSAGIQNKILEAMAMATPIVTTTAGADALEARHRGHLLIGDDPAVFADEVVELLDDARLQRTVGAGGRRYVETHHHWSPIVEHLESIYREAIHRFQSRAA